MSPTTSNHSPKKMVRNMKKLLPKMSSTNLSRGSPSATKPSSVKVTHDITEAASVPVGSKFFAVDPPLDISKMSTWTEAQVKQFDAAQVLFPSTFICNDSASPYSVYDFINEAVEFLSPEYSARQKSSIIADLGKHYEHLLVDLEAPVPSIWKEAIENEYIRDAVCRFLKAFAKTAYAKTHIEDQDSTKKKIFNASMALLQRRISAHKAQPVLELPSGGIPTEPAKTFKLLPPMVPQIQVTPASSSSTAKLNSKQKSFEFSSLTGEHDPPLFSNVQPQSTDAENTLSFTDIPQTPPIKVDDAFSFKHLTSFCKKMLNRRHAQKPISKRSMSVQTIPLASALHLNSQDMNFTFGEAETSDTFTFVADQDKRLETSLILHPLYSHTNDEKTAPIKIEDAAFEYEEVQHIDHFYEAKGQRAQDLEIKLEYLEACCAKKDAHLVQLKGETSGGTSIFPQEPGSSCKEATDMGILEHLKFLDHRIMVLEHCLECTAFLNELKDRRIAQLQAQANAETAARNALQTSLSIKELQIAQLQILVKANSAIRDAHQVDHSIKKLPIAQPQADVN